MAFIFGVASASHIRGDLDRAGQEIARASRADAGPSAHSTVLLLADCLVGDLQGLVQGIYRITGPRTPIAGGAAGDELKFVRTFVFHNDKVVEEGEVALWIGSEKPLHVVTKHGWDQIGVPMLVTRAEGTEIIELGGRPAALAYEEQLGLTPGQLSADKFWDTSLYHPFGLLQTDGSSVIQVARTKTEQNTLRIQGCVPPSGSVVQVMTGTADTLLDIVEEVANTALHAHSEAAVLLAFSCAARKVIFGARVPEEAHRLQAAAGSVPTFGLLLLRGVRAFRGGVWHSQRYTDGIGPVGVRVISWPPPKEDRDRLVAAGENVTRPGAAYDAPLKAAQAAIRDTSRLTRLFTVLSEPAPLALMLDRVLSTLSELFAADIVVLVDPAGSGTFSPLAAVGLPEVMIDLPISGAEDGYVATAMTTGTSIVKTDVSADPKVEFQFRELGTETAVWVPVIGSHEARGVLILARCYPAPFAHADVDLLAAMAYRIGLALEQAQRSVQLEQIVRAGREIARNLDESAICSETVGMLLAVVGADAAALVLNDLSGTPRCVAQFGLDPKWNSAWSRLAEHLLSDSCLAGSQPYSTPDLHAAVETISMEPPDSLPVRALLAVPIRREKGIEGLLYAMRFSRAPFSPDTIQVAML